MSTWELLDLSIEFNAFFTNSFISITLRYSGFRYRGNPVPDSRLLSLLIICIALPEWLMNFLHRTPEKEGQRAPNQLLQNTEISSDVDKAMEEFRLYSFEREVLSSALTAIYEAETKGILKVSERDRLAEPYKENLKLLDSKIEERRRVADFYNLQKEKKELQEQYSEKMNEIDRKIGELRSLIGSLPQWDLHPPATKNRPLEILNSTNEGSKKTNDVSSDQAVEGKALESKSKTKTEEKMETLREEVLRAIERLEQMESEA